MSNLIVTPSATIVFALCLYLIFHPEYEDGVFGRIALALMGFAAFAAVYEDLVHFVAGTEAHVASNIGAVLWPGVAIFLARHVARFTIALRLPRNRRKSDRYAADL